MTLDDLKATLSSMPRGQAVHVPTKCTSCYFRPVSPTKMHARGDEFVKANGCVIENRPNSREVLFVKLA
jgi:hypothetical protein